MVSITINADLKIEDPEDFFVVLTPSNNIEQPFPVRVNPDEGTTTVTIEDEDGKYSAISLQQYYYYNTPPPSIILCIL